MTGRVDFYIAGGERPAAEGGGGARTEVLACRLAEKAWRLGHRVYVHTAGEEESRRLDQLLWTFSQGSFVPHRCISDGHRDSVDGDPVAIGHAEPQGEGGREVLINLQDAAADWFGRFNRIAEVVGEGEDAKARARERYKKYKEGGVEVAVHNL